MIYSAPYCQCDKLATVQPIDCTWSSSVGYDQIWFYRYLLFKCKCFVQYITCECVHRMILVLSPISEQQLYHSQTTCAVNTPECGRNTPSTTWPDQHAVFVLAVLHLKEGCEFPHLKLHVIQQINKLTFPIDSIMMVDNNTGVRLLPLSCVNS